MGRAAILTCLVLGAACGSAGVAPQSVPRHAASPTPSPAFGDLQVLTGVLACATTGTAEDVYYPRWGGRPAPAIMFIHGGSWSSGSRTDVQAAGPLLDVLRARGYAVVSIDYRLAPAARWPAMLDDARCALQNLEANAAGMGLDPKRIGVLGVSAGAQLALLLGFTLPASQRPAAVIDVSGPVDLTSSEFAGSNSALGRQVFGATAPGDPVLKAASPITYVAPGDPPVLIVHGTADSLVPFDQAQELQAALQRNGDQVVLITIASGTHDLSGAVTAEAGFLAFLQAHVQPSQ